MVSESHSLLFRDEKNMLKAMRLNGILPLVTVPLPNSNGATVLEYELKFYQVEKYLLSLFF